MKRTAALVLLLAAAVAAHAGELIDPSGNFVGGLPGRIVADGVVISPVTLADALANGYREPTQADYDARDAANAEAAAQAAAFDFPDPEVVVPVLDADGERTGTARLLVDATGQIVVVTDTASPQRTAAVQIAEFKAKSEARRQKMSEGKAAAARANSVPALRAAVAQIIEALEE